MMKNFLSLIVLKIIFTIGVVQAKASLPAPIGLSVSEGFINPIGFYDSKPTFSWKLPPSKTSINQTAYSIVVAASPDLLMKSPDVWLSGKVMSNQSVHVTYKGSALKSRQIIYWQVRYWDEKNQSSIWSKIASVEIGLLSNLDWQAQWIKIPDPKKWDTTKYGTRLFRPQYLRKQFSVNSKINKARLYITSKGVFEAYINGKKIGNDVLTPGWTPYQKRIETLTYDITDALQKDKNTLGLILTEGWHSGRFGPQRRWDTVLAPPQIICQLEIEDLKGNTKTIATDKTWKAFNNGPIRTAGLYDGEVYDANYEIKGWNASDYDDKSWQNVAVEPIDSKIKLLPKRHATIKNKMKLQAVGMTVQGYNRVLFDLGQNMVGVVQIKIPVKKGDTIKLRHGEMLSPNGELFTDNLGSAPSIDYYIAKENKLISWQPKFTFHGFRYVEVSGYSKEQKPQLNWITGMVQHSDFEMAGNFQSSHTKLNQLHSNIQWGLRGNFFDIPLDCPQRSERLGWTGDAQVFIPTSLFLADTHAFWAAWLTSMREEQFANGGIPVVVPNFTGNFAQAGWSDACTIIPWELYYRTGDTKVLQDNYEMMQKWCDYHTSEATNYISHMSTVGDWLQPFSQQKDDRRGDTPNTLISTAFYAYSVKLTMKTAEVLGHTADKVRYQKLFDSISQAFEKDFFDVDGKIKSPHIPTQTGYLLALGFDILPKKTAEKAINHLVKLIHETDNHLRTGFIGTPLLAPVLSNTGNTDLLYEILFKETYPSWFYAINQGATTMWERWDGYTHDKGFANRALSFNHYAYGAIGQWMYERIGGIAPLEAGYKKIVFAPVPNPFLSEAKSNYNSPFGKIISEWKFVGSDFVYNITVPSNTSAKVVIPNFGKSNAKVTINRKQIKTQVIGNNFIFDNLQSGSYELIYSNAK